MMYADPVIPENVTPLMTSVDLELNSTSYSPSKFVSNVESMETVEKKLFSTFLEFWMIVWLLINSLDLIRVRAAPSEPISCLD